MNEEPVAAIRKRQLHDQSTVAPQREANLARRAVVGYSSEDPAHPVEHLFDGNDGPGGTCWRGARVDTNELLVLEFDEPQHISRVIYEAEERHQQRTQEVHLALSCDAGRSFQTLLIQPFNFSPAGATFQREDARFECRKATHLRLMIVPNKEGSGTATLTSLHVLA
jgi:hypothetical protein